MPSPPPPKPTVDPRRGRALFGALAAEWWDPAGKMAPLHKFNPVRLGYIRDQAAARFGRDPKRLDCLKGLRILDIGCGGGILSRAAGAARRARWSAPIRRRPTSRRRSCTPRSPGSRSTIAPPPPRRWPTPASSFDIVLAMEVVEHVADVPLFVATLRRDGEARRADDRRHAQPHAEELRARHRRRRIRAALAAARHPSLGQVRHARTNSRSRWSRRGLRVTGEQRRDLQSPRRPLAAFVRHGRELHAGRRRSRAEKSCSQA